VLSGRAPHLASVDHVALHVLPGEAARAAMLRRSSI